MRHDLSTEAKQSFQIVALLATVLVVAIHYKSDAPETISPLQATGNQLAQEFLLGGIARVAVPLFAFAAGFFYFRSDDGSLASYCKKLKQRTRTVWIPFFIVGSIALASWILVRRLEDDPVELTMGQFLATWLLRPPAEQLWFLRDLLVLITIAPMIRWLCSRTTYRTILLFAVGGAWAMNWQFTPIVAGWHLLHCETLLFFAIGCLAVDHANSIERCGKASTPILIAVTATWFALIAWRITLRADFDIWYATQYSIADLLVHQASILLGCIAVFMISWRLRHPMLLQISGASFFVYLVHEFPLRAFIQRVAARFLEHDTSAWLVTPLVIVGTYSAAFVLSRCCPTFFALVTGGRLPSASPPQSRWQPATSVPSSNS